MRDLYPLVVDVQSDILGALPTRMVVPLSKLDMPEPDLPKRLCPRVKVKSESLVLIPFEAAPIPKKLLKKKVGELREYSFEILAAMDAVLSGV